MHLIKKQFPQWLPLFVLAIAISQASFIPGCSPTPSNNKDSTQVTILATATGLASYYGRGFEGKETASGKIFDSDEMVAAHPSYPLHTAVRVHNLENGKSVQLKIIDRGPTEENQREGVIIDLSKGVARQLGMVRDGRVKVKVEVLQWGNNERQ